MFMLAPSIPTPSNQGETKCAQPIPVPYNPSNTAKAMKALQQQNHPIQPQLDKALSSTKKKKKLLKPLAIYYNFYVD